jgi:hypothetical protein
MSKNNAALAVAGQLAPGRHPASQATHVEQSRAVAEVQAMVVVAQRSPRSEADALRRIMESCGQKELAERAFFKFPRGGQTVSGPSIQLALELARCWGNIDYGIRELARDDAVAQSEMIAFAWDLEHNTRSHASFIVPHMRDKRGGAERLTDMRDIYENNANNGARRLREMIFRVIPPYIRIQAEEACRGTLERGQSEVPVAQRIANLLTAFEKLGISRERIEAKVGLNLDAATPVDIANLGIAYRSITRNEVTADEEFPTVNAAAVSAELRGNGAKPAVEPAADATPAEPTPAAASAAEPAATPAATSQPDPLAPLRAALAACSKLDDVDGVERDMEELIDGLTPLMLKQQARGLIYEAKQKFAPKGRK